LKGHQREPQNVACREALSRRREVVGLSFVSGSPYPIAYIPPRGFLTWAKVRHLSVPPELELAVSEFGGNIRDILDELKSLSARVEVLEGAERALVEANAQIAGMSERIKNLEAQIDEQEVACVTEYGALQEWPRYVDHARSYCWKVFDPKEERAGMRQAEQLLDDPSFAWIQRGLGIARPRVLQQLLSGSHQRLKALGDRRRWQDVPPPEKA
jgi:hypothetical protein